MSMLPILLLALPFAAPQDRVNLATGEVLIGEVQDAQLDEVVLLAPDGSENRLKSDQVLLIEYGGAPELLGRGRAFLRKMDYQNAVATLGQAAEAGGRDWVRIAARLEQAEALLAWSVIDASRAAEAVEAFRTWMAAHANSYHQVRARIGLARAHARGGDANEASKVLEELATLAFEKNLGRQVEFLAKLERSQVLLESDQAQVASARLRDLVPSIQEAAVSPGTEPGLRTRLRELLSRAQILLGDSIEVEQGGSAARAYWDGLLRDRLASIDVRAAALSGLAKQALAGGRPREAQLLLAQVVGTLQAGPEVSARALYLLAEVSGTLNNDIADDRSYYQQIVDLYPEASWAVKAREKLDG